MPTFSKRHQRLVVLEKSEKKSEIGDTYKDLLEPAIHFISNPCNIWESGRFDLQRLVLKMVLSSPLTYDRQEGFSNHQKTLLFSMLEGFCVNEKVLVGPEGLEPAILVLPK